MGFIIIDENTPSLTEEEKREIMEAAERPIVFDDAPELTDEQLKKMKRVSSLAV